MFKKYNGISNGELNKNLCIRYMLMMCEDHVIFSIVKAKRLSIFKIDAF